MRYYLRTGVIPQVALQFIEPVLYRDELFEKTTMHPNPNQGTPVEINKKANLFEVRPSSWYTGTWDPAAAWATCAGAGGSRSNDEDDYDGFGDDVPEMNVDPNTGAKRGFDCRKCKRKQSSKFHPLEIEF